MDVDYCSETDLECLFQRTDPKNEIFYFKNMNKMYVREINVTQIIFTYSYGNKYEFQSKLMIDGCLTDEHDKIVFCIGMTSLLWYWMGFGTDLIVIEAYPMTTIDLSFWQSFYNQLLLEFKYVNSTINMGETVLLCKRARKEPVSSISPLFPYEKLPNVLKYPYTHLEHQPNKRFILCPLGGGKDSLVVWRQIQATDAEPVLLYCSDSLYEFESNWRLQQVASLTQSPLIIVRHDFRSEQFDKHVLSYLNPAGHPWAALVLFDSLLISRQYGFAEVWLGHERSADEGNGVFWQGREVNHQFDKSSEFLKQAREYINTELSQSSSLLTASPSSAVVAGESSSSLSSAVDLQSTAGSSSTAVKDSHSHSHTAPVVITSALSDMWELDISKIFCKDEKLQKFHSIYLSCNEPVGEFKCDWCMRCEKCCFVYLIMSAWLPPDYVINHMFKIPQPQRYGESKLLAGEVGLYHDMTLLETFKRLVSGGVDTGMKALECVGTFAEASAAVELSLLRHTELYVSQIQSTTVTEAESVVHVPKAERISLTAVGCVPPVLAVLCTHLNIPLDAFISVTTFTSSLSPMDAAVTVSTLESQIMGKWNSTTKACCQETSNMT